MKPGSKAIRLLSRGMVMLCLMLPLATVLASAQPAYADYYYTTYESNRTGNRMNFRDSGDQVCYEEEVHIWWYQWIHEDSGQDYLLDQTLVRSEWQTFCDDKPSIESWTSVDNYTFEYYTTWDEQCRCYAAVYSVSTDWYLNGEYQRTDCCLEYDEWYVD